MEEGLGSLELSKGKIYTYLFIVFVIFLVYWYSANLESDVDRAKAYWFFGLGVLFIGISALHYTIGRYTPIFRTITYENSTLLGNLTNTQKKLLFSFCLILFILFVFIVQLRAKGLISAPTFQAVKLDLTNSLIFTFALAVMEGIIFVGVVPAIVYGFVYDRTKNIVLATISTLLLSPTIFMFYHFARYGFEDMYASLVVWGLNFLSVLWVLVFRNLWFEFALHGGNNVGLELIKGFGVQFDPVISVVMFLFVVFILAIFSFIT